MAAWWPEASRRWLCKSTLDYTGGPAKGLLHTTEGSTFGGALSAYETNNSWPHFTVSFENATFQAWQHVPIDKAARSLRNDPGGVQTNRAHVVQVEIVGSATTSDRFNRRYLDGIRRLMRWVEANAGVRRGAVPFKAYPASYGISNGVRMTGVQWSRYDGWCGHQHAPENSHGDPGAIDIAYLLDLPAPLPLPPEDDDMNFRYTSPDNAGIWVTDGAEWKRAVTGAVLPDLEHTTHNLDQRIGGRVSQAFHDWLVTRP